MIFQWLRLIVEKSRHQLTESTEADLTKKYILSCDGTEWGAVVPEKLVHFESSPQIAESSHEWRRLERSWKEFDPSRESGIPWQIKSEASPLRTEQRAEDKERQP